MCSRFGDLSSSSRRLISRYFHSQELTFNSISTYWITQCEKTLEQSEVASMTPGSSRKACSEQSPESLHVWRGTPHFALQDTVGKLALSFSFLLTAIPVLHQLHPPQWIHVVTYDVMCFLFGSLVPEGPLFRVLPGTSIACSTSPHQLDRVF